MNIIDAEEFFKYYRCSHFLMCREEPDKYKEYVSNKELENRWKNEEIHRIFEFLTNAETLKDELWMNHSILLGLIKTTQNKEYLIEFLRVTELIKDKVDEDDKIIIAETLIGRSIDKTDGAIRMSFELGLKNISEDYITLCLNLLSVNNSNRGKKATLELHEIKRKMFPS